MITQTTDEQLIEACSELDADKIHNALDNGAHIDFIDGYYSPVIAVMCGDGFWRMRNEEDELKYGEAGDVPQDVIDERKKIAIGRQLQCLSLLLAHGVDVNLAPEHEWSVGFHAVGCEPEVVRFLLEHGMNPNLTTEWFGDDPTTALSYAWDEELINRGNPEIGETLHQIVLLFLEYGALPFPFDQVEDSKHDRVSANQDLVAGCQHLDYASVMSAVKRGADISFRQDGKRSLPVIAIEDAPRVRGPEFTKNGWNVEDEICEFVLFLLGGMSMPLAEREIDEMIFACKATLSGKVLSALKMHHEYGALFKERENFLVSN